MMKVAIYRQTMPVKKERTNTKIQQLLNSLGWTRADLCRAIRRKTGRDIDSDVIHKICAGNQKCFPAYKEAIANTLGINEQDYFGEKGEVVLLEDDNLMVTEDLKEVS